MELMINKNKLESHRRKWEKKNDDNNDFKQRKILNRRKKLQTVY